MLHTGNLRQPETHRGEVHDATAQGGTSPFRPPWEIVRAIKSGAITWEVYEKLYNALLQVRYEKDVNAFHDICLRASEGDVTICCYCYKPQCHRYPLADFLRRVADEDLGLVI